MTRWEKVGLSYIIWGSAILIVYKIEPNITELIISLLLTLIGCAVFILSGDKERRE